MPRARVVELLGQPEASHPAWDGNGTTDYWNESRINAGYDRHGTVVHIGFSPGGAILTLRGNPLWSAEEQVDPNPALLGLEPSPVESVGILIFASLGVSTSGYHDDDPSQFSLTTSPANSWDDALADARTPDLSRYQSKQVRHSDLRELGRAGARRLRSRRLTLRRGRLCLARRML